MTQAHKKNHHHQGPAINQARRMSDSVRVCEMCVCVRRSVVRERRGAGRATMTASGDKRGGGRQPLPCHARARAAPCRQQGQQSSIHQSCKRLPPLCGARRETGCTSCSAASNGLISLHARGRRRHHQPRRHSSSSWCDIWLLLGARSGWRRYGSWWLVGRSRGHHQGHIQEATTATAALTPTWS